jgi:hypothetical protein
MPRTLDDICLIGGVLIVSRYLSTDESIEAIKCLEKVWQFLCETDEDYYQWKWVIIAVHSTLQSFMVLALKGGNSLNVLTERAQRKWLEAYQKGECYPVEKLDLFMNLYQKVQTGKMDIYIHSKRFIPAPDVTSDVEKLNSLRNRFIHFLPGGWSLEIDGLPRICKNATSVVSFLFFESGNISFYDEGDEIKIQGLLEKIKDKLAYGAKAYIV